MSSNEKYVPPDETIAKRPPAELELALLLRKAEQMNRARLALAKPVGPKWQVCYAMIVVGLVGVYAPSADLVPLVCGLLAYVLVRQSSLQSRIEAMQTLLTVQQEPAAYESTTHHNNLCNLSSPATDMSTPIESPRPPLPPFTLDPAIQKVRAAEDGWNSRNPEKVSLAYTPDSRWRNRSEFLQGRAEIVAFLTRKWQREQSYRLIKELWAYGENRIAVRFAYEWHDDTGQWYRSYGNENWEFDAAGLMSVRHASINDLPIAEADRLFDWPQGRRPDDHPGLSELGL